MARGIPTIEPQIGASSGARPPEIRSNFANALDGSFGQLNDTLNRSAAKIQADMEQRQREKEELWVTGAVADANAKWTEELFNRKLKAPDDPTGMTAQLLHDYDNYSADVLGGAPSPRAREMLAPRLTALRTGFDSDSAVFEATGRINARVSGLEQGIDKSSAALQQDPLQYEQLWGQYDQTLKNAGSTLPLEARDKLRTRMENLTEGAIYGFAAKNPFKTLKMIDSGMFNGRINPDRLMSMRENIKNKTEEINVYALYKGEQQMNNALAYMQQNGKLPDGFSPAAAASMGGGKPEQAAVRLAEFNDKAKLGQSVYDMTTKMREMNPTDRAKFVMSMDPRNQHMGPDYANKTALYGQALQYSASLDALQKDDPMSLVQLDDSPIGLKARMDKAWANVQSQGSKGLDSFRETLGQALLKQKALGVSEGDLSVMTKNEAQAEVDRLKNMPADQVKAQLDSAEQTYGEYYPVYLRQLDKLGLHKGFTVAASMPNTPVSTDLINSMKVDQGEMKKFLEGPESSAMETAINSNTTFQNFVSALNTTPGMGQDQAVSYRNAIAQLSYYYYSTHKYGSVSDSVQAAISGTIGSQFAPAQIGGKAMLLPMFMNGVPTTDSARNMMKYGLQSLLDTNINKLAALGPDVEQFGDPFPGATKADKTERLLDAIKESGYWVTNKDATGARLYIEGVDGTPYAVKRAGGGYIEYSFQDAYNIGHTDYTDTGAPKNSAGGGADLPNFEGGY